MERAQVDEGSLGERILRIQRELSEQLFTAEDRRKVIRVVLDGAQKLRTIELEPHWAKSVQSQNLAREVFNVYTSAREKATAAAEALYAEAGLTGPVSIEAEATLRDAMSTLPGVQDLMRRLENETVRVADARGGVTAEFDLRGQLRKLEVRSRYATETEPERLAVDICSALRGCEDALVSRRGELASALTDDRSFEERSQQRLEEFTHKLADLRRSLP